MKLSSHSIFAPFLFLSLLALLMGGGACSHSRQSTGPAANSDKEEKPQPIDWTQRSSVAITCEDEVVDLTDPLNEIAGRLEAQKLMYGVRPFTDCSGIFHRLLDSLNRRCPEHAYPSPKKYRSSRAIGRWYHQKGSFIQVREALEQWEYIKPGAVLFYVSRNVDPLSVGTESLFKSGGIRHVGVVLAVEKDENGIVSNYTLFHGRSRGKIAARTSYHRRIPTRASYPPYGNGRDRWIGVAPVASDFVRD